MRRWLAVVAAGFLALGACKHASYAAKAVPPYPAAVDGITLTVQPPLAKVGDTIQLGESFTPGVTATPGQTVVQKWTGKEWLTVFTTNDSSFVVPQLKPGTYRVGRDFKVSFGHTATAYAPLRIANPNPFG